MGRLPPWYKSQLRECCVCGFWYPERDGRITKQDNRWVCRWDKDSVRDKDRTKNIN
ncbi:hypothetical protein M0R04_11870 [Candidatus Dojkabacteria bacterium]|jgi:hypothetical protein|nr:hypothetical protein [Candidatus Dojkabacteria bacterium]